MEKLFLENTSFRVIPITCQIYNLVIFFTHGIFVKPTELVSLKKNQL